MEMFKKKKKLSNGIDIHKRNEDKKKGGEMKEEEEEGKRWWWCEQMELLAGACAP